MSDYQSISNVTDFNSLFRYLEDVLGWPLDGIEDVEDALYEFDAREFGLDERHAARIEQISQIAPLTNSQPWGIFWIDFGKQRPSVTAMRGVLRGLVKRKRDSANESERQRFALENLLFILTSEGMGKFDFAYFRGDGHARSRLSIFGWEKGDTHLRTLCDQNLPKLAFPDDPSDTEAWLKQWREAFDVERVTKRFFDDYKDVFARIEEEVKESIPDTKKNDAVAAEKRRLFTQRLFNRLMFIYFLQKKGWLSYEGDTNYLRRLLTEAAANGENVFEDRLFWLFFSGLGRAESRDVHESKLLRQRRGNVPYLNGGLFEKDEDGFDERGAVSLSNESFERILQLFERYNFTIDESSPTDVQVAVDPEMLGKVFEELVTGRGDSGSYYTPREIVQFMCREALIQCLGETGVDPLKVKKLVVGYEHEQLTLGEAKKLIDKLESIRILDPACGSGAYLLGVLQELTILTGLLDTRAGIDSKSIFDRKLAIIKNNLYGVDKDNFAVQIARLRIWLSLAVDFSGEEPQPLPNLDFKIECGDSLTAPDPSKANLSGHDEEIDKYKAVKAKFFEASLTHPHDKDYRTSILTEIHRLHDELAFWVHTNDDANAPADAFDWAIEFAEVFRPDRHGLRGFDVVLANPPYGAKVDDNVRDLYFERRDEGSQSKDTYGLFMARGLQLLRKGGVMSYIVSDTWRTIKSHLPLRRRLLAQSTVKHFLDLPSWIFKATVNTCILTIVKTPASEDHTVIAGDLSNLPIGNWRMLEQNLRIVAAHGFDAQTLEYARYTYPQILISTYENLSFFVASPELYTLMSDPTLRRLGSVCDIRVGLQTGDNQYYLRKREGVRGGYEILDEDKLLHGDEIANLTDKEKLNGIDPKKYGGRHFLPYDKGGESDASGGWLPNYCVPTGYFIDWSKTAVHRLRTATIADVKRRKGQQNKIKSSDEVTKAAVIRSPQYYFRDGITFSRTGVYAPTYRLNSSSVFDTEGSAIFSDEIVPPTLLGLLSSRFLRYQIKVFIDHTVHAQVDDLKELMIPSNSAEKQDSIAPLVRQIIEKQKADPQYPYHLKEQKELDGLVFELYGLTDDQIREVEIWYCRRYQRLAEAQGVATEVRKKYEDYLAHCGLLLSKPPEYWTSHRVHELIAKYESSELDFKQFYSIDMFGTRNQDSVRSTMKALTAFLNSNGGTVLLGVTDAGEITGINQELQSLSTDRTKFEEKIRNTIRDKIKPYPDGKVHINFHELPDGLVCQIDVERSKSPTYFDNKLYVRNGNTSPELAGPDLTIWIRERTNH